MMDPDGGLDLVVHNAAELVTYADHERFESYEDGAVAVVDGRVAAVGPTASVTREFPAENATTEIDAAGQTVVPGFVDPHTHAAFAGDRSDEFEAKLRGQSYQDILAAGGGILRTVRATRDASLETLTENLRAHIDVMLAHGSTTVEVKSGYGLDVETECRMLEAIAAVDEDHPVDLVPTFMGAHAVPETYGDGTPVDSTDEYVDHVVDDQLPAVADQGIAEFCDVFCETDVFDVEQSRRVLAAGVDHGFTPKVHAEELSHIGGTKLAAEMGAASADHLLHSTEEDAAALADADVTPVFLPGTAFGLGADYADAEQFLAAGARVALASDFNPNCFARTMPFAMTLACVGMRLTPNQALGGATRNAAHAVDRPDRGHLQEDAPADMVVADVPSAAHLAYRFDGNPVGAVVKDGKLVVENGRAATDGQAVVDDD